MRHLIGLDHSNYDVDGFKPDPFGKIKLYGGGGGKSEPPPPPAPPAAPPAEKKDPEVDTMMAQKKSRAAQDPMPQSTMLTGMEGVDMNSLSLGKNNLLGG